MSGYFRWGENMSAFVVEHKTINRIVSKLRAQVRRGGHWEEKYVLRPLLEAAEISTSKRADEDGIVQQETWQALGVALLVANVDAVMQRYAGSAPDDLPGQMDETLLGYQFRIEDTSAVAALKCLDSLHYQMAEGDVPDRPIYKALEALRGQWALQIVRELPEYDAAPGW